jgi:hypothetical protein
VDEQSGVIVKEHSGSRVEEGRRRRRGKIDVFERVLTHVCLP